MTIEEAKILKQSLVKGKTTYTLDPALYEDYKGLPLRVYEFAGTKDDLLNLGNRVTRANAVDPGTLVFCSVDGVIAKRTSITTESSPVPTDWWTFYGDATKEHEVSWHTLEYPE